SLSSDPLPILHFIIDQNIYGITKKVFDKLIEVGDKHAIRYALEVILTQNNKEISLLDNDNDIEPWTPLSDEFESRSHFADSRWSWSEAMNIAAGLGDFDTVKLLHRSGIKCCTEGAMNGAAGMGRLDIIEWLHTHRTEGCNEYALIFAASQQHLNIVQWLHDHYGLKCTRDGLVSAATNGDVDMVSYLISIPMTLEFQTPSVDVVYQTALDEAATNGHIDVVKILSNYSATTAAMDGAVRNGHFDMVQYLHTNRKEGCSGEALSDAIRLNRFKMLNYLVVNKCCHGEVNFKDSCIKAAGINSIEMLSFCMNQVHGDMAYNLKQEMMFEAAKFGLLDIFKWLHETKGFGWSSVMQEVAETRGHENILRYIEQSLKMWSTFFT
ncbi:hypothetical protein THRCLA_05615, partial [Thraustotheca clavata]